MPDRPSPLYEPFLSPAFLLLWFAGGVVFAAIWQAATASWPPAWARLVGALVLFAIVVPLDAALARRHHRRRYPTTRHRKTPV